jgi:anti-sigma regulatory factor (Ser/Thr protein kinase)
MAPETTHEAEHIHAPGPLRHHALLYDGAADYLSQGVPFIRAGLAAGEGGVVAVTRARLSNMREALGDDAERVTFIDVGSLYTRPARTIAGYHRVMQGMLAGRPGVRLIAEVQYGPTALEWREWMAYEARCTRAYGDLPAWILCTYDVNATPDPVLDDVRRVHPEILSDGWQRSPEFEQPEEMLRGIADRDGTDPLPGLRWVEPGADTESFRETLASEMRAEGVPQRNQVEMLVAGGEIADNAWRHGGGPRTLRTGRVNGRFVFELSDHGQGFDDPLAGYLPPRNGEEASGLWVARQLAWEVESLDAPDGHTVRVWV